MATSDMADEAAADAVDVRLRPLTEEDAAAVTAWRYEDPWSVYDGTEEELISAEKGYRAIADRDGGFLGFVCTGPDARVAGLAAEPGVLDVGVGLDPSIVGRGRGAAVVGPVLDAIAEGADAASMRAVVQSWNERSLRLCARLGFREAGRHVANAATGDVEYVVMVKPLAGRGDDPTAGRL